MKILRFITVQGVIYITSSVASWDIHYYHWSGDAIALAALLTFFNFLSLIRPSK